MDGNTLLTLQRASELIKTGKRQEAFALLTPIVRDDKNNAEAWFLLGMALTDPEKRLYAFKQVVRIDPDNQAALKQLARLAGSHAVPESAAAAATSARATVPTPAPGTAPDGAAKLPKAKKRGGRPVLLFIMAGLVLLAGVFGVVFWLLQSGGFLAAGAAPTMEALPPGQLGATPRPTVTAYTRRVTTPIPTLTAMPAFSFSAPTTPSATPFSAPTVNAAPDMSIFSQPLLWRVGSGAVESRTGHLVAGQSVSVPIYVDTSGRASFTLLWVGNQVPGFTITSPDHPLIDHAYAQEHPKDLGYKDQVSPGISMARFEFANTTAGVWLFNIQAAGVGDYQIDAVFDQPNLVLSAGGGGHGYRSGDIVTLAARLQDGGVGFDGATITVTLNFPDRPPENVLLIDRGDGKYAATYELQSYAYYIEGSVIASGTNHGYPFTRQAYFNLYFY